MTESDTHRPPMTLTEVAVAEDGPDRDRVFEYGVSVLRLVVPSVWGGAVAWGATHGVHLSDAEAAGLQWGIMLGASAGWYAAWHWIESKLPPWATRLVLGSNTPPRYPS